MTDREEKLADEEQQNLEQAALRLLAGREHSRRELRRKLNARTSEPEQLEQLLRKLSELGMQSDSRFAREYVAARSGRGFGPVRIRLELKERGISAGLADECLDREDEQWDQILLKTLAAKFGSEPPADLREWAKRARFLEYRGFAREQIRRLLRG